MGGEIYRHHANRYTVVWEDGTQLQVDDQGGYINLYGYIAESRQGKVTGLIGDFDGDSSNDLTSKDGINIGINPVLAELYGVFGNSWRIAQEESLFFYGPDKDTSTFTKTDFPQILATTDGLPADVRDAAETECRRRGITDPTLLDNCILDVGTTGNAALADVAAGISPPEETVIMSNELCGLISTNTTIVNNGLPYKTTCQLYISQGQTLTIEPGVTLNFAGDAYLHNQGTLRAIGTATAPITFRGTGGGTGQGIYTASGTVELAHAVLEGMAFSSPGAQLWIVGDATVTIDDSIIRNGPARGIYVGGSIAPVIRNTEISGNGQAGIWVEGGGGVGLTDSRVTGNGSGITLQSNAQLTTGSERNAIFDNISFGLQNQSSVQVNAPNNWWGDMTGPNHSGNPGGLGDKIDGNVLYQPWLTTAP